MTNSTDSASTPAGRRRRDPRGRPLGVDPGCRPTADAARSERHLWAPAGRRGGRQLRAGASLLRRQGRSIGGGAPVAQGRLHRAARRRSEHPAAGIGGHAYLAGDRSLAGRPPGLGDARRRVPDLLGDGASDDRAARIAPPSTSEDDTDWSRRKPRPACVAAVSIQVCYSVFGTAAVGLDRCRVIESTPRSRLIWRAVRVVDAAATIE